MPLPSVQLPGSTAPPARSALAISSDSLISPGTRGLGLQCAPAVPRPDLALTLPGSSSCPSPFRQFVLLENTASQWEFPRCEPEPTPGRAAAALT